MEIIVSHQMTDLDGLGAMVAANKLYPGARPVFTGRLHRTVRDFLVLYKDEIRVYNLEDIDIKKVNHVIMVDTWRKENTGDLYELLDWDNCQITVYDHHRHEKTDWIDFDYSEEVGSATTILIKRIIAENLHLNPFEATICALAIYADTGNLTHLSTSPDDVRALAYLLEAGANLKIINDFIKEPLSRKQEQFMEELIKTREEIHIDGVDITIFSITSEEYIPGLNRITEQIKKLYHLSNVFVIFHNGNTAQIIARSSDEAVDAGKICSVLGGGGHSGAAAAKVRNSSLEEVKEELIREINKNTKPHKRIRAIMSSPVRTVSPDTSIAEVEELMKKYGHNAFVVYENDEIKGIFSRSDLSKVKGHNLMHAPVKAYMSKDVITIDADAPVNQAQKLMVKNGVGRLPVMDGDKMVGIVTRSNILAAYYGTDTPYQHKNRYGSSLVDISRAERDISAMLEKLPADILEFLKKAGLIAESKGFSAYLIGGMVRDILLGKENRDLDIVVDGVLDEYIEDLVLEFSGKWDYNRKFRTGSIELPSGFRIDLAETRKEVYQYTGALPEVESTDILEDLFRRDYTINVLAIGLNPGKWGILLDYFSGEADLEKGLLRALHRFSFLDDPTRIIRGIRLAVKLGFTFEEETSSLIEEAISTGDFSRLSIERVFKELKLLFEDRITPYLIKLLRKYPVFKLLNLDIAIEDRHLEEAERLEEYLADFHKKNYNIEDWLIRLAVFTDGLKEFDLKHWNIKNKYKNILLASSKHGNLIKRLEKNIDNKEIVSCLSRLSNEELLILLAKSRKEIVEEKILHYLENLRDLAININGNDLKEMGVEPGPLMREILEKVYQARLNSEVKSREEELEYVRNLLNKE